MRTCPCCGQLIEEYSRDDLDELMSALDLYYELGDGCVWAPGFTRRVGFYSQASADKFKQQFPNFNVLVVERKV